MHNVKFEATNLKDYISLSSHVLAFVQFYNPNLSHSSLSITH